MEATAQLQDTLITLRTLMKEKLYDSRVGVGCGVHCRIGSA